MRNSRKTLNLWGFIEAKVRTLIKLEPLKIHQDFLTISLFKQHYNNWLINLATQNFMWVTGMGLAPPAGEKKPAWINQRKRRELPNVSKSRDRTRIDAGVFCFERRLYKLHFKFHTYGRARHVSGPQISLWLLKIWFFFPICLKKFLAYIRILKMRGKKFLTAQKLW